MFVLYVTILLDYTIETTENMMYQVFQLVYTIAVQKQEREESRRERGAASNAAGHSRAHCQPSLCAVDNQTMP